MFDDDPKMAKMVVVVLAFRAEYLAEGNSALKHWNALHDKLLIALRTSATMSEVLGAYRRGLRLGAPSRMASMAMLGAMEAGPWDDSDIERLDDEIGLVIALARQRAESRAVARKEKKG